MQFPKEFFEDEVRDGFYITSLTKRAWAAQMEIYMDIAKVCKECGIEFWADWGTLLGAVRHGGFIPWDDDMDICIMMEDADRFEKSMKEHLPPNYSVLTYKTPDYNEWFIRIVNSNRINTSPEFAERYHEFPFAAGMDVFLMSPVVNNEEELQVINSMRDIALNIIERINGSKKATEEEIEKYIVMFEEMLGRSISRESKQETKQSIVSVMLSLYSMYDKSETPYITIPLDDGFGTMFIERSAYDEAVELPFENITVRAPKNYEHVLQKEYGDYMKKVRRAGHDYPFYEKQKAFYEETNGKKLNYHITSDKVFELKTRGESERKKILFLPWKADGWKKMEKIWEQYSANPECDVRVIPVPYYYRKNFDTLMDVQYEAKLFPDDVPVTGLDEFDMESYEADVIFFQCPFDGVNYGISVHPYFYSTNLRQFCKELVYVQYCEIDEIQSKEDISYYVLKDVIAQPGIVFADQVLVQSESMRQYCIEYLTEWAGEETLEVWEEKLKVLYG